jgi:putative ABC transport system permease protein
VAGAVILAGLGGVAAWLASSPRVGGYFAGGLAGSLAVLSVVAWLLLRLLRGWLRGTSRRLPNWLRQGLANVHRQGNHAQPVLVALGMGVMFTLTIYLVQDSLLRDLIRTAPPGMPNVFLIDITQAQAGPMLEFLKAQPGLEGQPELVPSVAAKLVKINGTPVEQFHFKGWNRRFQQTRSVMFERTLPEATRVVEGAWWDAGTETPVVSIAEEAAKDLNLHPGAKLEFLASGRTIEAEVRAVHRTEAIRVAAANEFVFNPKPLEGLPTLYYGGVRMKPQMVGNLQRGAYEKFPTVTVVNIADALEMVQEVVDQIAVVIRFLAAFAILAGAVILAASVAGSRLRRVREVVILKTLGARRQQIARIFSAEFLMIGAVAGLLGAVLAVAFSNVVMRRLLEAELHFDAAAVGVAIVGTALLANAAGWLASFRILGQKPLEVLREE